MRGTSYDDQGEKHGVSKSTTWNWFRKSFHLLKNPFQVFRPEPSDVVIADETGTKINGERSFIWSLISLERVSLSERVSWTRDKLEAFDLLREGVKNLGRMFKFLITDGLPGYRGGLRLLLYRFKGNVKTIFLNREPKGKSILVDEKKNAIIISQEDDCVTFVYKGLKDPRLVERTTVSDVEELVDLTNKYLEKTDTVCIYTNYTLSGVNLFQPFSEFLDSFKEKANSYVYHIICGKDYFKAYVENFLKWVKRRIKWFDKNFRSLKSAVRFIKLRSLYYNVFKKHRAFEDVPFRAAGADIPQDKLQCFKMLLNPSLGLSK